MPKRLTYDVYIGTKLIQATPLENLDGDAGYQIFYPDGYQSWCPQDAFEAAYRLVSPAERELIDA